MEMYDVQNKQKLLIHELNRLWTEKLQNSEASEQQHRTKFLTIF